MKLYCHQRQSYLISAASSILASLLNWILGFVGLEIVKLEEAYERITRSKNNDGLDQNQNEKQLKSLETEECERLTDLKYRLIQDFKKKLWNFGTPAYPVNIITPSKSFDNILDMSELDSFVGEKSEEDSENESKDAEAEMFLSSLRAITPTRSFNNGLNLSDTGDISEKGEESVNACDSSADVDRSAFSPIVETPAASTPKKDAESIEKTTEPFDRNSPWRVRLGSSKGKGKQL